MTPDMKRLLTTPDRPAALHPSIARTRDGLGHVDYTWKRQKVKHIVVDPVKLVLKPIVYSQRPQ
jgi:hypothetical protein